MFPPADTALTHPLFLFLMASVTLLPPSAALPVFSVDFNQNPLPVFWKCQGVAVVRMSSWLLRIQYIKRVFTALQLGSAFTVSSSAVCLEKGRNGKLPRVCRQFWHSAYSLNSLAVHSILPFFSLLIRRAGSLSSAKGWHGLVMLWGWGLFPLNDKLLLWYHSGWLKSVFESRSRALLGSCTQGLCGQNVPFYSQGLPGVSIAGGFQSALSFCAHVLYSSPPRL